MNARRLLVGWRGLALAVGIVFSLSLTTGFVWDDVPLIERNERLLEPGAWTRAFTEDYWDSSVPTQAAPFYWRPIPKLSHYVVRSLGGTEAAFHGLNVALHLAVCLLVFVWLRRRLMSSAVAADAAHLGAFAGALLFAVHPSRFEAVGWISCSTELFFGLFVMAGVLLLDQRRCWPLALGCFSLAMMSKETALVVPVALALDAWLCGKLRARLSALAVSVVGVSLPLLMRVAIGIEAPRVADVATLAQRVARVLGAWAGYHLRTFFPTEVTFYATDVGLLYDGVFDVTPAWWAAGAVLVLAWATGGALTLRRPEGRALAADAGWWAVLLGPVLLIVTSPNPIFVSDRFLYLPLIGVCAMVARGFAAISPDAALLRRSSLALGGALTAGSLLIVLGLPAYANDRVFTARELALHPDSALAFEQYASVLSEVRLFTARGLLLERELERPMPDFRRAKLVTLLAKNDVELLPDAAVAELQTTWRFFAALATPTPPVSYRGYPMPHDPSVVAALVARKARSFDDVMLRVEVKLGRLERALAIAEQDWKAARWYQATITYAKYLAYAGRWGEVAPLLDEAARGFPSVVREPAYQALRAGVTLAAEPPSDEVQGAVRLARLYGALESPRRAREVLEPLVAHHGLEPRFVDARVQAELDDRCFGRALALLEQAREARPDEVGFVEAAEEVRRLEAEWNERREAEALLASPENMR